MEEKNKKVKNDGDISDLAGDTLSSRSKLKSKVNNCKFSNFNQKKYVVFQVSQ